jgi:ribosomal protein S18 acetylase RimI-like enzyme
MLTPPDLESYMRHAAALTYRVVDLPPFVLFFNPDDPLRFFNYARPTEPVGGDLRAVLAALVREFRSRDRLPRFEFIEEFAPHLAPALAAAGFTEEARQVLMTCTPSTYSPAPEVPGLDIIELRSDSAESDLRSAMAAQRESFGEVVGDDFEAKIAGRRDWLASGAGSVVGRLASRGGAAAGVAEFTPPLDGFSELVGIATLPAQRGHGIATALTARAVAAAFQRGVKTAFLVAADERAGRVYERVGFRPYATALAYALEG